MSRMEDIPSHSSPLQAAMKTRKEKVSIQIDGKQDTYTLLDMDSFNTIIVARTILSTSFCYLVLRVAIQKLLRVSLFL